MAENQPKPSTSSEIPEESNESHFEPAEEDGNLAEELRPMQPLYLLDDEPSRSLQSIKLGEENSTGSSPQGAAAADGSPPQTSGLLNVAAAINLFRLLPLPDELLDEPVRRARQRRSIMDEAILTLHDGEWNCLDALAKLQEVNDNIAEMHKEMVDLQKCYRQEQIDQVMLDSQKKILNHWVDHYTTENERTQESMAAKQKELEKILSENERIEEALRFEDEESRQLKRDLRTIRRKAYLARRAMQQKNRRGGHQGQSE